jgi:uncharacterized membrane protein
MKTVIQILLAIAIVVLGYLLVDSINQPIRFKAEQAKRYDKTIQRLKEIRPHSLHTGLSMGNLPVTLIP